MYFFAIFAYVMCLLIIYWKCANHATSHLLTFHSIPYKPNPLCCNVRPLCGSLRVCQHNETRQFMQMQCLPWLQSRRYFIKPKTGGHPSGVANLRRRCCFIEIKPVATTEFCTQCPVAPTQDQLVVISKCWPLSIMCPRI